MVVGESVKFPRASDTAVSLLVNSSTVNSISTVPGGIDIVQNIISSSNSSVCVKIERFPFFDFEEQIDSTVSCISRKSVTWRRYSTKYKFVI